MHGNHSIQFVNIVFLSDLERPKVFKRIPRGDFISTLGYEGQRVYMQLWDEDVLESEVTDSRSDKSMIKNFSPHLTDIACLNLQPPLMWLSSMSHFLNCLLLIYE